MMAILQDSFKVVDMLAFDRENPRVVPLTRKVAGELVLLSVLAPLAVTDIAVPFSQDIYCTDASLEKGAILRAAVSKDVSEVLWKTSKTKGAYSRLLSPVECVLKQLGELEEVALDSRDWNGLPRSVMISSSFFGSFENFPMSFRMGICGRTSAGH